MSDSRTRVAVGDGTPLQYLPLAIRLPARPIRAIAVGWLTAFPFSIVLAMIGAWLLPHVDGPEFHVNGLAAMFALVVFSPVVETLIMGGVLLGLLAVMPPAAAIVASSVGWGIAHSLAAPIWALIIWWPFLVFSTLFVAWRHRSSWLAFLIPMCVHALQNLIPAVLVAEGLAG